MIVLAFDPGLSLGWATNSTRHHRGDRGIFDIDDWVAQWHDGEVAGYSPDDLLARRLAAVRRIADATLAHVIQPDCFVVERQLTMKGKTSHVNRDIEKVLIELAGALDILLLRPAPNTWQAWARAYMPQTFEKWLADKKSDDVSAVMMRQWAIASHRMEAA